MLLETTQIYTNPCIRLFNQQRLKKLYETTLNSSYPTVAWSVASLMLQMSLFEAFGPYRDVQKSLRKAGITHYLRKNHESLILAILILFARPFGMLGFRVMKFVIRWTYEFRTRFQEYKYTRQLNEFCRWRLHWVTSAEIKTVGDPKASGMYE